MKKAKGKHLLIIFCISFFCSNLFAQGPAEPGDDPLVQQINVNETVSLTPNHSENKTNISVVSVYKNTAKTAHNTAFHQDSGIYFYHFLTSQPSLFFKTKVFGDLFHLDNKGEKKNQYSFNFIKD